MNHNERFFAEWVYYNTDEEKEQALTFLNLWKHYTLEKFNRQPEKSLEKLEYVEDSIIIRGIEKPDTKTICMKLHFKVIP